MTIKPNYSEYGYQIIHELGHNREGGRITWLASSIATDNQVVIKQYSFAQIDSSWSGFNTHQREIEILQKLNHPRIPKYLAAFPTVNGFCLVQEYVNAPSLAVTRTFQPEDIKKIAIQVLEILTYLQGRFPCIIHRDIKPENILVDAELNVYLIDFGLARIGSQEVSGSSVFVGTPGFIPPEQLLKPTTATDLYALGVTLICLLTNTKSTAVQNLIDEDDISQIRFRHLLPKLSLRFLDWLEMMVQPRLKDRFENAQQALNALIPLDVTRCPQVEFSHQIRDFTAISLHEKIRESITIENSIPDTLLQGRWEVAPHPHDPPHQANSHPWIKITPQKFAGNHIKCDIEVDTSQLMADKLYKRQLLLHTNAYPAIHTLTVKVQTALIPIEKKESKSYPSLIWAFLTGEIATVILIGLIPWIFATLASRNIVFWNLPNINDSSNGAFVFGTVGAIAGSVIGAAIGGIYELYQKNKPSSSNYYPYENDFWDNIKGGSFAGLIILGVLGIIIGGVYGTIASPNTPNDLVGIIFMSLGGIVQGGFVACIVGAIAGGIIGLIASFTIWAILKIVNDWLSLLTAGFGISVGLGFITGLLNQVTILALGVTGIPLLYKLLYAPIQQQKLISKYRRSEQHLIKP
ncbi:serine/threonine protein kinase [Calothrix sp. FACHB-1219]|uniref:serine/threonine protein kinase n=1 Tax=unclassified Calothrix TaxID=2619626 RepID=UPI001685B02D|nr:MULTISPECIES: serine/threonine-protein kinase [unclassified Calothrix]MBD2202321.1 serine/threonine protein kinase [Calothrix sp. FACHB-168]MBD2217727.1 serine/threonine protein kinase [Calothrix sp. FACHB-1219]